MKRDENPDGFSWFDRRAMAALRPFRLWPRGSALAVPFVLALVPFLVLWAVKALHLHLHLPKPVAAVVLLASFAPSLFMFAAIWRALDVGRAYQKAYDDEDIEAIGRLKRLMDGTEPPHTPFDRANRLLGEAELLLYFERWAEARDVFAKIDRSALLEMTRPGVLSEHGLATAHAGQPELGLELAERAWREAEETKDYPATKMWFVRARLGIVLSLAGKHDDANEVLLDVFCTEGGDLRTWTAAHFFHACSLRANGNFDEAATHLGYATEGEGPYVQRAKAALQLAKGAPHRASAVAPADPVLEEEEGATCPESG